MSHFTAEQFGLRANKVNLEKIKSLLKSLASQHALTFIENKVIHNRFLNSQRIVVGLEGDTINPLGFQVSKGEFVCQVDLDDNHFNSDTKSKTISLFQELQARIIDLTKEDAIGFAQTEADKLRQSGVNVSVKVH